MIPRSYLYVPGNDQAKLTKALTRGADALIVDLEDAVPPSGKEAARALVREWLASLDSASLQCDIWVRLNPATEARTDIAAIFHPVLTGVMVAKAENRAELEAVDRALDDEERARGMTSGSARVVPLLESASAVLACAEIAAAPRVARLQVGEADLMADIGVSLGPDESELAYVRSHIVLTSSAHGLDAPVAPVSTNFKDLDAFRVSTEALARRGFIGRACIHPAQIDIAHQVFSPSAEQIAAARDVIERFDAAIAQGVGVVTDADGRMVDEAIVRQARRVLALARD